MPISPEEAPTEQLSQTTMTRHKKIILGGVLCIALIVGAIIIALILSKSSSTPAEPASAKQESFQLAPDATPFPFEDLTISYLRQKEYQSSLAQLGKISDNGSYTSYLTSYKSEGLKINGLLTVPDGEKPGSGWPAIVFVHGYIPPNQYRTQERYLEYVSSLAQSGFVVFKIDLRGHGDSEGEPGGGYFSGDYVMDTLNAYSALQKADFVNSQKIGLWGHSMAGNILLRAMAAKPEIPVSVIWAGAVYTYTDQAEYGIHDASYQPQPTDSERQRKRKLLRELYGNPDSESWFWKQVAPTNYLTDLKGAIQLNHAVNDDVVSIEYSRNLNRLLDATQVPHQLNEYSNGGHNISGSSFNQAMLNTISFFNKYLKK